MGRASKIGARIGHVRAGEEPTRFAAGVRVSISRPEAAPPKSATPTFKLSPSRTKLVKSDSLWPIPIASSRATWNGHK